MDLNSDMGEAFGMYRMGDDEALLDVVSSANVACGFHAGDPQVMAKTVRGAVERDVVVGAHVSYPDLVGFGRRPMAATPAEVTADVIYQLGALDGVARTCGSRVRYVKPHGALYNTMAVDGATAQAVVDAVAAYDKGLPVLTLPGSVLVDIARRAGVTPVLECFADRAYTPEGKLVPRGTPGAVISDEDEVLERSALMATADTVRAVDGTEVRLGAATMCLHSDTPGAAKLAAAIRARLEAAGVTIQAFA